MKDRKRQPLELLKSQCHRHYVIEMFLNFFNSVLTSAAVLIPCKIAERFRSLYAFPPVGSIILDFHNYQDSHTTWRLLPF